MERKHIDIGVQGNDGTGDSIRDSFNKVNENFKDIYSIFGQGDGTIGLPDLSDGPASTQGVNQVLMTNPTPGGRLTTRTLVGTGGITITKTDPNTLTFTASQGTLVEETEPALNAPINVNSNVIGPIPNIDDGWATDPQTGKLLNDPATDTNSLIEEWKGVHGAGITLDQLPVSLGYANDHYLKLNINTGAVDGSLRVRSEPAVPDVTNAEYDGTLTSNYLSTEVMQRKDVVYRGGDTMTGKLYLNDHPAPLEGFGTPTGPSDLQAATKYYVDNNSFSSGVNLYVSTSGDDIQTKTPPGKEGRFWQYAYRTVGQAALAAENLISASSQEPGPYRQRLTYNIGPDQYFSTIRSVDMIQGNESTPGYQDAYDLLEANKSWIQAETIAYINNKYVNVFTYNKNKCQRDVATILNAVADDLALGTTYNSTTAGSAYLNATAGNVLATQLIQTIDAINFARDQVIEFSYDSVALTSYMNMVVDAICYDFVFKSNYQCIQAALHYPAAGTNLSEDQIVLVLKDLQASLTALIADPLNNTWPGAGAADGSTQVAIDASFAVLENVIRTGNVPEFVMPSVPNGANGRVSAQKLLLNNIAFMQSEIVAFLSAEYPSVLYSRDTCKRDVKFMVWSLVYDAMYEGNSRSVFAGQRYYNNGLRNVPDTEKAATIAAINYLGTIAQKITANDSPAIVYQQSIRQYRNETLIDGETVNASIAANIATIADIVDNIANIPVINRPNVTVTASELRVVRTAILDNIDTYAANAVNYVQGNGTVEGHFPVINDPVALARINYLFKCVTDILELGLENRVPSTFSNPNNPVPGIAEAVDLILTNTSYIKAETIAYITQQYPSLSYSSATCERDVELLLEAICYDITYECNAASTAAGKMYWYNSVRQISNAEAAVISDILQETQRITVAVASNNEGQPGPTRSTVDQVFNPAYTRGAQANASINFLWSRIIDLTQADITYPAGQVTYPTFADFDVDLQSYRTLIKNHIDAQSSAGSINIALLTTNFLDATYKGGFNYDEAICYRDVGYIIDAMAIDVITGGTYQSINAGKSYYKNASAKAIAIGIQYKETVDAIKFAKNLALRALNQSTASLYQTLVTQYFDNNKSAAAGAITAVSNNMDTLLSIIENGYGAAPTPTFGTGLYNITISNGGKSSVEQGAAGNNDIIPAKALVGITSGAYASIVKYTPSSASGVDTIQVRLTKPGFFKVETISGSGTIGSYTVTVASSLGLQIGMGVSGSGVTAHASIASINNNVLTLTKPNSFTFTNQDLIIGEQLEFGETVKDTQITIFVESGIYYEDYPIRLPANCSIKGDEFRRTIIRPRDRISQSPWRKIFFYRDSIIDAMQLGLIDRSTDYAPATTALLSGTTNTIVVTIGAGQVPSAWIGKLLEVTYTVQNGDVSDSRVGKAVVDSVSGNFMNCSVIYPFAAAGIVAAGNWHLYDPVNYGRHYLVDPLDVNSQAKNNKEIDAFLCNDATRIGNISFQGHGGFAMVLDPEGQIKTKSPYGQVCSSFSQSNNRKRWAGGQFVDGFTGRLRGTITNIVYDSIVTIGGLVGGTGYTNGTYTNVPLVAVTTSTGVGATADITVAGGIVTECTLVSSGSGYNKDDLLTADSIGTGTNFRVSVTEVTGVGNGITVTVVGETNSGLDIRPPQPPCAFYVAGYRYQIDDILSFDAATATVVMTLNVATPYNALAAYNNLICSRDVGLILEALSYDMVFGTATSTMSASTITGTTLTVGTLTGSPIQVGMELTGSALIPAGTTILANISGSGSGSTWTVSNNITLASTTITGTVSSNYQTVAAGRSYLRSYASKVPSVQLTQTLAGIDKAVALALATIPESQYAAARASMTKNVAILKTIITQGASAAPAVTYNAPVGFDDASSKVKAKNILVANRRFIRDEVVAWIVAPLGGGFVAKNIPNYNALTCSRDVGYMVDALVYDMIYGGNSQTKTAAEAYFRGAGIVRAGAFEVGHRYRIVTLGSTDFVALGAASNTVGLTFIATGTGTSGITAGTASTVVSYIDGEEDVVYAAYGRMRDVIAQVTVNTPVSRSAGNVTVQNVSLPVASSAEVTALNTLANSVLLDYIRDGDYDVLPATVYPTITAQNTDLKNARTAVLAATASIQSSVITYLNNGGGLKINIEMGGNKSMLANDFAMINDLGYAIVCTNGGVSEQVSTFTYYCHTHYWANNGGQIRSVAGSNAHGEYGLRASGYDVTELPDAVNTAENLVQVARVFKAGVTRTEMEPTATKQALFVYVTDWEYLPTSVSELEIDHSVAGKGIVRYELTSIEHTTITLNGKNILKLNLSTAGNNGTSSTGLAAALYHGQLVQIRALQNIKFNNIANVNPTRPSTALQYNDNLSEIYRVIAYNLADSTGEALLPTQAILQSDASFNYYKFASDPANVSTPDFEDTVVTSTYISGLASQGTIVVGNVTGGTIEVGYVARGEGLLAGQTVESVTGPDGSGHYTVKVSGVLTAIPTTNLTIYFAKSTLGSKVGDSKIAVYTISKQTVVDQINKGTFLTGFAGRVHRVLEYVLPKYLATASVVSYDSGTRTLVVDTIAGVLDQGDVLTGNGFNGTQYVESIVTDIQNDTATIVLTSVATSTPTVGQTVTFGVAAVGYLRIDTNPVNNISGDGTTIGAASYVGIEPGDNAARIITYDIPFEEELPIVDSFYNFTGNVNTSYNGYHRIVGVESKSTITVANTTGLTAGMIVTGENIPPNTIIDSIVDTHTITVTPAIFIPANTDISASQASSVKEVVIENAGDTEYDSPPVITFNGGDPTAPALAVAIIKNKTISEIKLISPGYNYQRTPTISLSYGDATLTAILTAKEQKATVASPGLNVVRMKVLYTTNPGVEGIATEVNSSGNIITLTSSAGLIVGQPITFSDTVMGNIGANVTAGAFTVGQTYTISTVGTTNFMSIGASANIVGTTFTATGAGSGTGTADTTYYIKTIVGNDITVSKTYNGTTFDPGTTTGSMAFYTRSFTEGDHLTITGTPTKSGTGPYSVVMAYTGAAQTINKWYRVSGNTNPLYNGFAYCTASSSGSITLRYANDPGTWSTATTTTVYLAAMTGTNSSLGIGSPIDTGSSYTFRLGYPSGTPAQITTRISTCRATGHDFLDIGTGSYSTTNYPYQIYGNPAQSRKPSQEVQEDGVGRVFYVTTDQNGIFRVGRFFTVDQGTGTVTFSASIALSNLDGLGFKRGVVVSEFSTDSSFIGNAPEVVPVQSAIRAYVDRRLGLDQGGGVIAQNNLIGPGYVPLNGDLSLTGNLNLGGHLIVNMQSPQSNYDAATKIYVDDLAASQDEFSELKDVSFTTLVNGNISLYDTTAGKWTNIELPNNSSTSDVLLTYSSITGKITSAIQAGKIFNSMVSSTAAIAQSKLAMKKADTRAASTNLQSDLGLSTYKDTTFTVTDGFVELRTSEAGKTTGVTLDKLQFITDGYVIGRRNGASTGAPAEITSGNVVTDGDGIKNASFYWQTGAPLANASITGGAMLVTYDGANTSNNSYSVLPITTSGGANSLVKTESTGGIDAKLLKIDGNLIIDSDLSAPDRPVIEYYTPKGNKFMSASSITPTAPATDPNIILKLYGAIDLSNSKGITLTALTAGASDTKGTITGAWEVQDSSSMDVRKGTLYADTLTTGSVTNPGVITGTWTLYDTSKLQATYAADLAEFYEGDAEYEVGTVLVFGGDKEVTVTNMMNDTRVAGVVSDNAAYSMNGGCPGLKTQIGLQGRCPVKVVGRVKKGDMLTTASTPGYAVKASDPKLGSIIGKALEDKDYGEAGVIEVAIGRM